MAGNAAIDLYDRMLIGKGSGRIGVAFGADHVLVIGGAQLLALECAVRIVAIRATHQAFIDLVVKRLREGWTHILVASEAKGRLF